MEYIQSSMGGIPWQVYGNGLLRFDWTGGLPPPQEKPAGPYHAGATEMVA
ncbi:MAG: hypothetical protein NPIRA03_30130 [Nitrospirales bacterium]|nr:MAG: hypothetical protein NPIRA03_30130 [Nitrospirales bacterium]